MYSEIQNIKLKKNLEKLAEKLVPEAIRNDAPQFFELIKNFLKNIQYVQDSLDNNFLDFVDPESITNEEVFKIYLDTYLAQMKLIDISSTIDLKQAFQSIKISKYLSQLKGTTEIYGVITQILSFLMVKLDAYAVTLKELIDKLRAEGRDQEADEFQRELDLFMKYETLTNIYVAVTEDDDRPFHYSLLIEISEDIFDKYIKPFCHPAGWTVNLFLVAGRYIFSEIKPRDSLIMHQVFLTPSALVNGGKASVGKAYLGNDLDSIYDLWKAKGLSNYGDESTFDAYKGNVPYEPSRLYKDGGKIYYDFTNMSPLKEPDNITIDSYETDGNLNFKELIPEKDQNAIHTYEDMVSGSWVFPSSVYNTANQAYRAGNPDLRANCGYLAGFYGKGITWRTWWLKTYPEVPSMPLAPTPLPWKNSKMRILNNSFAMTETITESSVWDTFSDIIVAENPSQNKIVSSGGSYSGEVKWNGLDRTYSGISTASYTNGHIKLACKLQGSGETLGLSIIPTPANSNTKLLCIINDRLQVSVDVPKDFDTFTNITPPYNAHILSIITPVIQFSYEVGTDKYLVTYRWEQMTDNTVRVLYIVDKNSTQIYISEVQLSFIVYLGN
jgi:hypothetical protein